MKFLLIGLIIRFLRELVSNKKNTTTQITGTGRPARVRHPAEFEVREDYYRIQFW